MSDATVIASIKSDTLAALAALAAAEAAGTLKPSYSIDGQSVSWEQYRAGLMARVVWADAALQAAAPFEITSHGCT